MSKLPPPNPETTAALAILDGALCRLNRRGKVAQRHRPLGSAIMEFHPLADGRYLVRESAFGLLPGISNLYCVDAELHQIWLAEPPVDGALYSEPLQVAGDLAICPTTSGGRSLLDLATGRAVS